jgi:dTDP-glucose 4,6-dehydratase
MKQFKSLLVTGGLGFIGSAFIRGLFGEFGFTGRVGNLDALKYAANPDNVMPHEVDGSRYWFQHGDITDFSLVRSILSDHDVDCIVNFAAETHVDRSIQSPDPFIHSNIFGTYQLLEEARRRPGIHFHHVSTDEVYGSLGPTGAFTETSPYQPNSPYSASKAAADHLVRAYAQTYGLSITISNASNTFGPRQFPEKLIPLMITNLLQGRPLPVYGDGLNVRDWLYVDDHAHAIWLILTQGKPGETYNVGARSELTNLDLISMLIEQVAKEHGKTVEELRQLVEFVKDRPGHDRRYAIDPTKIETELGFKAKWSLQDQIINTVRWYDWWGQR